MKGRRFKVKKKLWISMLVVLIMATACTPQVVIADKRVVTRQDKIVASNDNLESQPEKLVLTENPFEYLLGPIRAPDDLSVRPCTGEAPSLCVYQGTMVLGSVELATFPLVHQPDFQKILSNPEISLGSLDCTNFAYAPSRARKALAIYAAAYLADLAQDRDATYPEGYTFTPIAVEEISIGDLPGLTYGFTGIDQEGHIFERWLNYTAFDNDTLYLFNIFYANDLAGGFISDEELLRFEPYLRQTLAGLRLPASEDWHSPGAELPSGPRVVVQRPDNSIQYVVSPEGTSAILSTDAPNSLVTAGFDRLPMTDGPAIYIRQMWGDFYVLDTLSGYLIPLPFIPASTTSMAVRPLTEEALPEGLVSVDWDISLAWGEISTNDKVTTSLLYLATQDGSRKILAQEEVYMPSDTLLQFVPWHWGQGSRLYFSKQPVVGGYFPFINESNLWVYDLADGSSKELVSDDVTSGKLCLGAISPDERLVAHHCEEGQITLLDLETGTTTAVSLPDQSPSDAQLGTIRFNPDGTRIAFAMMTGGFELSEETRGYVAVSDSLSGSSHIIATSEVGEWFSVAEWLWGWGDILVLQSYYVDPHSWPAVWTIQINGSELVKLADGIYLKAAY
jgi:hypothetical protein